MCAIHVEALPRGKETRGKCDSTVGSKSPKLIIIRRRRYMEHMRPVELKVYASIGV
jgi:hypothetical protein